MKWLNLFIFLMFFLNGCSSNENDCNDCGGGLIDGYLYKEITIDDVSDLVEMNISSEIGNCIRFKMVESQFSDVEVVDDCCCIQFN